MLGIIQYIFSSTDVFLMTLVLIYIVGYSISMIVKAFNK